MLLMQVKLSYNFAATPDTIEIILFRGDDTVLTVTWVASGNNWLSPIMTVDIDYLDNLSQAIVNMVLSGNSPATILVYAIQSADITVE